MPRIKLSELTAATSTQTGALTVIVQSGQTFRILTSALGSSGATLPIAQADVTGLVVALAAKAADSHTHTLASITDIAASPEELNILGGATVSVGEVNILDGATLSTVELNYVDGVTSGIQAQLNGKAATAGLAAIATSGSAGDLSAGTLPAACFDDTAHGSRAGGALHANAVAAGAAGFLTGTDKTKLDATSGTNSGDQTITLTGNVTGAGTGSFAATIAAGVVTNAMQADMAQTTIKGRAAAAGTGVPTDLTATQVRTLINVADGAQPGTVTDVTGTAPVASSGGTTPAISMAAATNAAAGHATAAHIAAIEANTAKVTNATHTGDATGATVLTVVAINGVVLSGTPSTGQVLTATGAATANWQTASGGGVTPPLVKQLSAYQYGGL